jgi:hypothetical protein
MKKHYSLTDDKLKSYADEHLQYEIRMLVWSAAILAGLLPIKAEGRLAWAIHDGLLNTFAVHARNLIAFLYSRGTKKKKRPTDVVLQDYVDDDTVSKHLPPIDPLLSEALEKANKQVAHLTLERIEYEKDLKRKAWRFMELTQKILRAFSVVAPHIPPSRMSASLKERLSKSQLMIPSLDTSVIYTAQNEPVGVKIALRLETIGKADSNLSKNKEK